MSFPRFCERSRVSPESGFAAGAAFILAVILTGVALVVQSTVPVTKTPASLAAQSSPIDGMAPLQISSESQLAQAGVGATSNVEFGKTDGEDGNKNDFSSVCMSGMDYTVFYDTSGQLQQNLSTGRNRCAAGKPVVSNSAIQDGSDVGWSDGETFGQFITRPVSGVQGKSFVDYYQSNAANGQLDPQNRTCNTKKPATNPPTWAENIAWKCLVRVCIPAADNKSSCDIYAVAQGSSMGAALYHKQVADGIFEATSNISDETQKAAKVAELEQLYKVPAGGSDALVTAFTQKQDEIDVARLSYEESVAAQQNANTELNAIANNVKACEGEVECQKKYSQQLAEAQKAKNEADTEAAKNKQALDRLQNNSTSLNPGGQGQGGQPGTGVYNRPVGMPVQPSYTTGNNSFGANTPSPFGGSCTSGYVCQGNTLYHQTLNSYMGAPQCQTMPIQQCPYGCQQPQAMAQAGSQQQSTLGGIMAGIQIFSALSSMFGGSNNNSAMTNANVSRQCATSPQMQQQQQAPYGTGTNGQACQQQQTQQPDPAQCTSGSWRALSQNGCFAGWQCVPDGSAGGGQPTAQLSCQPKTADVGMPISFSFSCGNSSGSTGTGFNTGGAVSGNTTESAPTPPVGQTTATYTLTCIKLGVTTSAQCQVQIGRPGIVMVTNPKSVKGGETSLIGWVTSGMKSCVISSQDQQDFTTRNANITVTSGVASTSPIVMDTRFVLSCETLGGDTRLSETTITLSQ